MSSGDDTAPPSCSDLIGASIPLTGFGYATQMRPSDHVVGRRSRSSVMLRLVRSIHYANRLLSQHGGDPPIKSEGDDPAPPSCSDLIGASIYANRLWTQRK